MNVDKTVVTVICLTAVCIAALVLNNQVIAGVSAGGIVGVLVPSPVGGTSAASGSDSDAES